LTERKKIDKIKSEFISTVSHELRTPLTSIRGSLGLIIGGAMGEIPAKAKQLLDIANKNNERLVHLINEILDIEKIEADKMVLDIKPLNMTNLIEHAIEKTKGFAEQFQVNLVFHNEAPRVMVEADHDRFKRIFQKFAQADSSDTRQKGGTGLGLSITKAIVEKQGGLIGFNTEPGVGTIFYLKLPAWQE